MSALQRCWLSVFILTAAVVGAAEVRAAGIDRDGLLSEAPATPDKGTVRVTAGGMGQATTDSGVQGNSNVSGSILWAPFQNFAADVGVYMQPGTSGQSGPSARVRYQFLSQDRFGIDLAGGLRFKTNSFYHPGKDGSGEAEFLLAAGRRFGQVELVLNGVFGVETGGGNGKDFEVKGFAGWRFNEQLRAGVDSRLQAEVGDDEASTTPKLGRDFDFTAGPAVSWMVTRQIQLQALVGMIMPKGTNVTSPVGILAASFDF
jgi:hypothetical protein